MRRPLLVLLALLASFAAVRSTAQTFSTIFTFQQPEGVGGLVVDSFGNLYGTTVQGGKYNAGVIFKLAKPSSGGGYKFSVLHDFDGTSGGSAAGDIVLDNSGNLYGTTAKGGSVTSSCATGCGTIFKLTHPASPGGDWTFSVVYSFQGYPGDGQSPYFLSLNSQGVLFGTTPLGGAGNVGTVYQLTNSGLTWTESLLFNLSPQKLPCNPPGTPTFDSSGNVFFATELGGPGNTGCIVELTPPVPPATTWTSTTLWTFGSGGRGSLPVGPQLMNASGELFGVTLYGGLYAQGSFYKLTPSGSSWTHKLLYSFGSPSKSGYWPINLLPGPKTGTYYGGAIGGGYCPLNCNGTVYELTQPTSQGGSWTQSVLYTFQGSADGSLPYSLIKDSQGTLYGFTIAGGFFGNGSCRTNGCGTIFKISF